MLNSRSETSVAAEIADRRQSVTETGGTSLIPCSAPL